MRELDLAWAAGLFDGEGHTGARLTKYGTIQIQMQMHQKGLEVLTRLQEVLGGKIYQVKTRDNIHFWTVGKLASVENIIYDLWPYLSEPKQLQILKALTLKYGEPYGS